MGNWKLLPRHRGENIIAAKFEERNEGADGPGLVSKPGSWLVDLAVHEVGDADKLHGQKGGVTHRSLIRQGVVLDVT